MKFRVALMVDVTVAADTMPEGAAIAAEQAELKVSARGPDSIVVKEMETGSTYEVPREKGDTR